MRPTVPGGHRRLGTLQGMSRPPTLVLPSGARTYQLATSRGRFAVLDHGAARLGTALLVPGFTGSKEDFLGLLEPLAQAGFRAVAVDGRGQYESPGPREETPYTQPELARDLLAQAAALRGDPGSGPPAGDPHRPAADRPPLHLLGHSLGGLVARAAVLLDPAPFASLTLLSSGPAGIGPDRRGALEMLLGALPVWGMAEIWQTMHELGPAEPWVGDPPSVPATDETAEIGAFLRQRWLANVPEQLLVTGRQLLAEPDRVAELAALPLPRHVVSGERDPIWPVPWLDGMAHRLDARRTVIPGTEHSPNAERPETTAKALADFWSGVPPTPCGDGAVADLPG